jgi:hypothetical protein
LLEYPLQCAAASDCGVNEVGDESAVGSVWKESIRKVVRGKPTGKDEDRFAPGVHAVCFSVGSVMVIFRHVAPGKMKN